MTLAGYRSDKSPDRLDAMVWALTSLHPAVSREARAPNREPPKVVLAFAEQKRHGSNAAAVTPASIGRRGSACE